MHVGSANVPSKTVAMYFPVSLKDHKGNNFDAEQASFTTKSSKGTIHFVKEFRYLGSWITQNLRNMKDIDNRIHAAQYSLYELTGVFRNKHISLGKKEMCLQNPHSP